MYYSLVDKELMRMTNASNKKMSQSKQIKSTYMPRNKQIYTFGGTINVRDIYERPNFENEDLVSNTAKNTKMEELIDVKRVTASS